MGLGGKKGGGIWGMIIAVTLAILIPGSAAVTLPTLAAAASIGYTVGNLLYPPEFEEEEEEYTSPDVAEGTPVPLIFGHHRTRGIISYFDKTRIKKKSYDDGTKYFWGPMQVIVCMCEVYPVDDPHGSLWRGTGYKSNNFDDLYTDTKDEYAQSLSVRVSPDDGEPHEQFSYFLSGKKFDSLNNQVVKAINATNETEFSPEFLPEDFDAVIFGVIEAYLKTVGSGNYTENLSTQFTGELLTKSYPQISWGGRPVDTYATLEDPEWAPNTYMPKGSKHEFKTSKENFSGYWSDKISPLKNMLTLSSPVWYLGKNVSTAPNVMYEVSGIYPSEPGALFLEILTNQLWGMGLDLETAINDKTFTRTAKGGVGSFQVAMADDKFKINASIREQSAKSLIEKMNFHLGTILREDVHGRLELLAIRSLTDYGTYSQEDYSSWLESGAPDTGGSYIPGFPVLYEVYAGDPISIQVSNQLWSTTFSSFTGTYKKADSDFSSASVVVRNNAAENMLGFSREKSWAFNMFTDVNSVSKRLLQLSNEKSRPGMTVRMSLPASYANMRKGDGVKVWHSDSGLDGVYLRVASVEFPKIGVNEVSVECVLDYASLYDKNLLTLDVQVPDQGKEPAIPDDPADPLGIFAHPDFWNHNLSYDDASATGTNDKKTHIYVSQGNAQQVSHRDFSAEGPLNPYLGVPVPSVAKGAQNYTNWGVQFITASPLGEDNYSTALDGNYLILDLVGYEGQDLSSLLATKTDNNWETDNTVMIISGRPFLDPFSESSENVTEIIRFRTLEHMSGSFYRVENLARRANKERAPEWPIGTGVWIADLSEVDKDGSLPYDMFPNRSLAKAKGDAAISEGSHRVRMFTQSVTVPDAVGEEEGSGFIQPETEGLSITFDALNSQFFSGTEYLDAKIPPMVSCTAVRVGDIPAGKGLWFRANLDGVTNLLPDAFDLSSWSMFGGTWTPNDAGLGYARGNLAVTTLLFTGFTPFAKTATATVSAGLTNQTYSVCFLVSREQGDTTTFSAKLSGTGATDASLNIDWDTGVVSGVLGTASAYDLGNGVFRVFMSSTRTTGNDLVLNTFFNAPSGSLTLSKVSLGEVLLYAGTTEALYSEKDWLVQFLPMGEYGGIGDQSIALGTGGASEWGTFLDDDDEDDISTNQVGSQGTYRVFAKFYADGYTSPDLTLTSASTYEVTVSAGDPWPTMVISDSDLAAVGSKDDPLLASDFHPKQLEFRVAKQGAGSNYGVPYVATVKAPWAQSFLFKS